MLHSTLPRAFLTPGLKYLSNYYGEDVPTYQSTSYQSQYEEHYPRLTEHHVFPTWHTVQRSASPCPLDLSLKASRLPDENHIRDDDASRRYRRPDIQDVEEEVEEEKNHRDHPDINDDPRIIVVREKEEEEEEEEEEDKLKIENENTSIGIYTDDRVRVETSTRYQKSASSIHEERYNNHQILMTPQHHLQGINAPMTPPSTPSPPQCPRKRQREESGSSVVSPSLNNNNNNNDNLSIRQISQLEKSPRPKKKHARRLKFDEDTSSPVSGTVILGPDEAVVTGDIDPAFNVVEVTEEARAELAKIENRLGPYQCRLCRQLHEDAFQLAQHRCSRIAHVEYRCPECDKRFSCPANLASHRRWHKPRVPNGENTTPSTVGANGQTASLNTNEYSCTRCDAKFGRQAALRKHIANRHSSVVGNCNNDNNNGRNSAGSNSSGSSSSIVGNVEVLNHVGNHLGVSPLTVEMP